MPKSGPFKFTARCRINNNNLDIAEILISTTESHSASDGYVISPDLSSSTPESARQYAYVEAPKGQPGFKAQNDGTVIAPGGSEVRSTVWYVGVNLFNTANRCYFGGLAIL